MPGKKRKQKNFKHQDISKSGSGYQKPFKVKGNIIQATKKKIIADQ